MKPADKPTRLAAILRQKCPRCFIGDTFRRGIRMYECCPFCELRYEREQGYFVGAMYIAYGLGVALLAPITLAVWLATRWSIALVLVTGAALFLPLAPLVFRYSRVIWLHLDYLAEPW
jgi:uncharacterized protein (DUF983 family)